MANPYFLACRRDKAKIILGILIGAGECLVDPAATIVIGKIFNGTEDVVNGHITGEKFLQKLQHYIYWLVGITFYSAIINSFGYMVWVSLGYSIGHKARSRLYHIFMHKDSSWFDSKESLSGIAAIHYKDIQDIEVSTGITAYEIVAMSCGIIAQITVAFYYSWAVTLVCLAGIPVLVVVGGIFANPINKRILDSKALLDTISEKASWVLSAFKTVKIYQQEMFEWTKINSKLIDQQDRNLRFWFLSCLQQGLCRAIVLLIFVQGFYFGSYMIRSHGLRAGNVITVFWSCLNASSQLQLVMTHVVEWSKGAASAERLQKAFSVNKEQELMDSIGLMPDIQEKMLEGFRKYGWRSDQDVSSPKEYELNEFVIEDKSISSPVPSSSSFISDSESDSKSETVVLKQPKGHILFSEVVFSYPSRQEIVLASLDMEIYPGQTVFVLGHSGSGKSTLAALLSGQYPWQAGEISIDSHDIHLLSKRWIENNIYICEQFPKLFDISIYDNVRIGSCNPEAVTDAEVKLALEDSCSDFVELLPEGGNTLCAQNLSGGQQQRIALARARLRNAPIMLFDEVTSALDPSLQSEVFSRILNYRKGKTTIIVTHDVSVIPEGYPVFVIENGMATRYPTLSSLVDVFKTQPALNYKGLDKVVEKSPSAELDYAARIKVSTISEPKPIEIISRKSSKSDSYMVYQMMPKKFLFYIGMGVNIIHSVINPVFSFIFSKLVMGILDANSKRTTMWAMLVLAFAFIDGVVSVGKYVLNVASEYWLRSVRSMLFERVLMANFSNWTPELASYYLKMLISDSEKCAQVITLYWPGIISMISLGLVGFIWALAYGWKLTLVGSSILPAFVAINQLYKHITTKWNETREGKRAKVVQLMMDLTSEAGFRTVKVQHLEHYFKVIYSSAEDSLQRITPRLVTQVGAGYGTLKCFPYALESLLLWYGMRLIGNGSYSAQQTMTVFSLLMFTIITIDQLTASIGSIGTGFEALSRLMAILRELDPSNRDPNEYLAVTPSVNGQRPKFEKISFHYVGVEYKTGTRVLGSFNQIFSHSELVAIVGPSGVGKSSIANMLLRLQTPTSGEIVVDGKWDLSKMSINDVRGNITLVNQSPLDFFDGTISENLLYGLKHGESDPRSGRLIDVCKACGVHDFVMTLDNGYETRIKSGLLSGGQQQRLGIARALMRDPRVLILDECTSALDVNSKELIKQLILNLHRTTSMMIIMITHQMDVAEIADRIVQL